MLIWGGYDTITGQTNTGARYNPSTNSWSAITTVGAPSARFQQTAIWGNSRMVVWGGWSGSAMLNTGGVYNPSLDTWTPTSMTNAPAVRTYHTAVWTGTQMIVWG